MSTRVAFITGAAQGIGEGIALRLASDPLDTSIVIFDVPGKEAQIEGVVRNIEEKGRKAIYIAGDVSVEEDVKNAVTRCVETFGGIDIVRSDCSTKLLIIFNFG